MDINQALVAQEGNVTFWKKQLTKMHRQAASINLWKTV